MLVNDNVNSFLLTGSISETLPDFNSTFKVDCRIENDATPS